MRSAQDAEMSLRKLEGIAQRRLELICVSRHGKPSAADGLISDIGRICQEASQGRDELDDSVTNYRRLLAYLFLFVQKDAILRNIDLEDSAALVTRKGIAKRVFNVPNGSIVDIGHVVDILNRLVHFEKIRVLVPKRFDRLNHAAVEHLVGIKLLKKTVELFALRLCVLLLVRRQVFAIQV